MDKFTSVGNDGFLNISPRISFKCVSDGNSYKFGSSRRGAFESNRYVCPHSLVGGWEVVRGRQLPGGHLPRTTILGAVNLLLDELGRRLGRLQEMHKMIYFLVRKALD